MIRRLRERRVAQRAAQRAAHHHARLLATAADIAITAAHQDVQQRVQDHIRRTNRLPGLELRGRVDVADVQAAADAHFGLAVAPGEAAAALRRRYALRASAWDLDTDAYRYTS